MYPLNMSNGVGFAVANDAEEHKSLTAHGYEPAYQAEAAEVAPADEKAELQAKLDAKGIEYDARWGVKKLREALGE